MSQRTLFFVGLLLSGCFGDVWADGAERFPAASNAGTEASTTGDGGGGGSEGTGLQTVTGPELVTTSVGTSESPTDTSTSTGTSAGANAPPSIQSFAVAPSILLEAGAAHVSAQVSADVVELDLEVDGELVWQGPPDAFSWSFWATSAAASNGEHSFKLTVRDAEGLEDVRDDPTLLVMLPPSGQERCSYVGQDLGWITGAAFEPDALVLVGARSAPDLEATVWRLDPDSCGPMAGYPRSLSAWTTLPIGAPSQAAAVAVDELGHVAVAANLGSGLKQRAYVAVLKPDGALVWERVGPLGTMYSGVAVGGGRVVAVGEQLVGEQPTRYDGLVHGFNETGVKVWSRVLAAPEFGDLLPDAFNVRDERPSAVLWDPSTEAFVVVGERQVESLDQSLRLRGFTARYNFAGALMTTWTSALDGLEHPQDGLTSVGACGEMLVAGGWISALNAPQPATRWLDAAGVGELRRLDPLGDTTRGVACDREQKVTSVATVDLKAFVFAFRTSDAPFAFVHEFLDSSLHAAASDARGFCVAAGSTDGKPWVRMHHP